MVLKRNRISLHSKIARVEKLKSSKTFKHGFCIYIPVKRLSIKSKLFRGMGPDSRVLIRKSRKQAQQYYGLYKEPIPVTQLVRETAAVMQEFTQSGGVGPFGVSLLVAGYDDNGPQLYQVDPSGSYFSWKASAMGKNVSNAKTFLEKRYTDDMELDDAVHTAILTLKEGFEGQIFSKNIEIGIIGTDKIFRHDLDGLCWDTKPNTEFVGILVLEVRRGQQAFTGRTLSGVFKVQGLIKRAVGMLAEVFEVMTGRSPVRSRTLQLGSWEDFSFLSTAPPWALMLKMDTKTLYYINLLDGDSLPLEMPGELLGVSTQGQLVGCLQGNPRVHSSVTVLIGCPTYKELVIAFKRGGPRSAWNVTIIADENVRKRLEGACVIGNSLYWISDGISVECLDSKGRLQRSTLAADFGKNAAKSLIPSHSGDHLLFIAEAGSGEVMVTNTLDPKLSLIRLPYLISNLFAVSGGEGISFPVSFFPFPPSLFFATSVRCHLIQFSGGVVVNYFPCPFATERMPCRCSGAWFPHSLLS